MANYFFGWNGRIGRFQWWMGGFVQAVILAIAAAFAVTAKANPLSLAMAAGFVAIAVWFGIGLTIKRLHDRDKSGSWFFFYLIPFIGNAWQVVECGFLSGSDGDNDYGPDPRFRFNVAEDIEALRAANTQDMPAPRDPKPSPTVVPVARPPIDTGRPAFGKRG